jgi:hypothetical protein
MPAPGGRMASEVLHASVDTLLATIAGGLVLLVFYPLTLCAAGVKGVVRLVRPHPVSQTDRHITTTN